MVIPVCWAPQDSPVKEGHLSRPAKEHAKFQAGHTTPPDIKPKSREEGRCFHHDRPSNHSRC